MSRPGPQTGVSFRREVRRVALRHVERHGMAPTATQVRIALQNDGFRVSRQAVAYHLNALRADKLLPPARPATTPQAIFLVTLGEALAEYDAGHPLEDVSTRHQLPPWLITIATKQSEKFCPQDSLDNQQAAG